MAHCQQKIHSLPITLHQDWNRLKISGGVNFFYPSMKLVVYCAGIIYGLILDTLTKGSQCLSF